MNDTVNGLMTMMLFQLNEENPLIIPKEMFSHLNSVFRDRKSDLIKLNITTLNAKGYSQNTTSAKLVCYKIDEPSDQNNWTNVKYCKCFFCNETEETFAFNFELIEIHDLDKHFESLSTLL